MAPVLLVTAFFGVLFMLRALWVCFVGDGPYRVAQDPTTRFEDRASWWVTWGPGSGSGSAAMAALAVFTLVVLARRYHHPAVPDRLRLAGVVLTALLFLVELSGPLTVAAGWVQLSLDPTSARSFWDDDVVSGAPLVQCIVLTVLAALNAWILRSWPSPSEEAPESESTDTASRTPWRDEVSKPESVDGGREVFRRPTP